MSYERELAAVLEWLDSTDRIALQHRAVNVPTEIKADGTPVTAADQAIERAIRNAIAGAFPGDGIVGEEHGVTGSSARTWIIDPIDGTKNYARGIPVFATLIALDFDGSLDLGVVSAPALGARWWATRGGGAFCNGRSINVSSVSRMEEAHLCTGGTDWDRDGRLASLVGSVGRVRGFGDFWGHMLVAQGSMDAMVELAPLARWDVAAPRMIVEEAGGRWTGLDGRSGLEGPSVSSNGLVHEGVLRALSAR